MNRRRFKRFDPEALEKDLLELLRRVRRAPVPDPLAPAGASGIVGADELQTLTGQARPRYIMLQPAAEQRVGPAGGEARGRAMLRALSDVATLLADLDRSEQRATPGGRRRLS